MNTDRELMQQALEALEFYYEQHGEESDAKVITALRERLAQQEQEPVAWEDVLGAIARGWTHDDNKHKPMDVQLAVAIAKEIQDMVSAPPQRKPLTDEEIDDLSRTMVKGSKSVNWLCRAIEAAHGIGEKPDVA